MEITGKQEEYYWEAYFLSANEYGLTHIFHDKKDDKWWLVHATTRRFPLKYENGKLSGNIRFIV